MIQLPNDQAELLRECFEEIFDENEKYFDLIEIEDIYSILIGDESDEEFYTKLEQTAIIDEYNLAFIVFLQEWLTLLETMSVRLELFELAANGIELQKKVNLIIKAI